jgi:hypothetical protein
VQGGFDIVTGDVERLAERKPRALQDLVLEACRLAETRRPGATLCTSTLHVGPSHPATNACRLDFHKPLRSSATRGVAWRSQPAGKLAQPLP